MTPANEPNKPGRLELFSFYYLGFNPEGTYKFANAHHVARYYKVSSDAVLRWLDEYDLSSSRLLHLQYELSRAQTDLQLEADELTPEEILERAREILDEVDEATPGRKPWEDKD